MAVCVSLINMKGGVGKTTLAAQLAHVINERGLHTLVVDLDAQANLSHALLSPYEYVRHIREDRPTIVQIFEAEDASALNIHKIILTVSIPDGGLGLIPSRLELANTLKNPAGKERRLAHAIAKIADEYDLILIDCAPTESVLTQAAYHASRYVLVPVKPEYLATIGLPLLVRSLQQFRNENADHQIDICGLVFNHSSAYSDSPEGRKSIEDVERVAKKYGWHIFDTHVRYSASYAKAAREGTSIQETSYARWEVTAEFERLVNEFMSCIGLSKGNA